MARKARTAPVRPFDSDTLGRIGQTRFGEMCDRAGLIANTSERADRMGWDYYVEFPLSHHRTAEPFDSRTKMPDMKVQVKTIWSDRSTVDLELIAAERLAARWAFPSFIIILRMNTDRSFHDAWLIHLHDDNLARILRALRQAEAAGSLSIKNKTISFSTQHGIRIDVDGSQLAVEMRSAIGNGQSYITRKADQLRNLGFEEPSFQGSFKLKASSESELLDIFLGLKKGDVTQFDAQEVRFGIPLEKVVVQSGQIGFKPRPIAGSLVLLSSGKDKKRATLPVDVYYATTGSDLNRPSKVRVVSPLLEMTASSHDSEGSLTVGPAMLARCTLNQSIQLARAQHVIASGPCTAQVKANGVEIGFKITHVDLPFPKEHYAGLLNGLTALDGILRGIGLSDIELRSEDISSNWGGVRFIAATQWPDNGIRMSIKVIIDQAVPAIPEKLECLFASSLVFETTTIVFWATAQATAKVRNNNIRVRLSQFSLRDICAIGPGETVDSFISDASKNVGLDFVIRLDGLRFDDQSS